MSTPAYTLRCTLKELIAPWVYEIRFPRPEALTFKAGQFVLFDIPLFADPSDIQTRALSIASSPAEADLIFVIKIKSEGRLGQWIVRTLEVGTEVRIQGPFGLFLLREPETSYILTATGAGIAPFRSQAKWFLEEKKDMRPLTVIFGVREPEDFFWLDGFRELETKFSHFKFLPTLSGKNESWTGARGRVQTHLENSMSAGAGIYICGAPEMVKDVKETCLGSFGVPKAQVHAEGYI